VKFFAKGSAPRDLWTEGTEACGFYNSKTHTAWTCADLDGEELLKTIAHELQHATSHRGLLYDGVGGVASTRRSTRLSLRFSPRARGARTLRFASSIAATASSPGGRRAAAPTAAIDRYAAAEQWLLRTVTEGDEIVVNAAQGRKDVERCASYLPSRYGEKDNNARGAESSLRPLFTEKRIKLTHALADRELQLPAKVKLIGRTHPRFQLHTARLRLFHNTPQKRRDAPAREGLHLPLRPIRHRDSQQFFVSVFDVLRESGLREDVYKCSVGTTGVFLYRGH
jgi:hypothetical protein